MRKKVFIAESEDFSKGVIALLSEYVDLTVNNIHPINLIHILETYDVFWFRLNYKLDRKVLKHSVRCKYLVTPVTGIDHIDEKYCKLSGIEVISLRGEIEFLREVRATAEHTIGLLLCLIRNTNKASSDVLKGNWRRDLFRGSELYGKTLGIIGYGRLGRIVAGYASAFGMKVIAFDKADTGDEIYMAKTIHELCEKADIVSLHASYSEENLDMVDENVFMAMRPGAYFINTSRGGLVKEDALLSALQSKHLAGAALDVIQNEYSFSIDNPLVAYANEHANLLLTPHIGGNTYESFEKTERFIAMKLLNALEVLP